MLKHHFIISLRTLFRHKNSFFINLAGLSTGLSCAFLIWLWVNDEIKTDKFHEQDKQLYQVMELSQENEQVITHESTQGPLADAMARDLPEVESAALVMSLSKENIKVTLNAGNQVYKSTGVFASANFFRMFSFPLLYGDPSQVLADKDNIVLSDKLAGILFGSPEQAMGNSLQWEIFGMKKQTKVAGIFTKPATGNTMDFEFALTQELLLSEFWPNGKKWSNEGPQTYLLLKKGTDISRFNAKIRDFTKKYHKDNLFTLFVRPYSSGYLYGKYENGVQAGGRIAYVKLFSAVALFILVIACINFMNLATAKASRRLKEVGIRKTIGSTRKSLILQFLTESLIMSALSVAIACATVPLLLPLFSGIMGKQLEIAFTPELFIAIFAIILVTGLISGSYPAFYLSGFNPIAILKGKIRNSVVELLARKGLVVFQFMVSLVLIIAVLIIYKQVDFIQSKNLGYNKSNLIYFDKEGVCATNTDAFLTELKKIPGVVNASAIQQNIVQPGGGASTYGIEWPGKPPDNPIDFLVRNVDFSLIETLDIQFSEGRSFSKDFGDERTNLILNETAIRTMGLKNPVGTKIRMWEQDMTIIGVVKDFHVSSMHEPIAPMVFRYDPDRTILMMARIEPGREKETLALIEAFYKKVNPGYVFDYKFLDGAYQSLYAAEKRVSLLSGYFAGLAILISCLGLFGLAAYNAEIRTKEIGIRKVLGASAGSVALMLSRDFFKLIGIAVLIAFPLAWWALHHWLNDFVYKIRIGPTVFAVALITVVVLTILTVSFQAIRAALANPVKSLRAE